MAAQLLSDYGSTKTILHRDAHRPDEFHVELKEDCESLIQRAKSISELRSGFKNSDGWRHQRVVPNHVLNRALIEGRMKDDAWWKSWANSPEGMVFATEHNGRKEML